MGVLVVPVTLLRCLPGASGQAKELAPCKNLCLESSVMVWGSARGYRKVFRCLSYCHGVVVRLLVMLVMNTERQCKGKGAAGGGNPPVSSGIGVLVVG